MSVDSEQTKLKSSSSKKDEEQGAEEEEKNDTICRRFLNWVSKELFDWNPGYVKTLRGMLHLLHVFLSALVMTLVGSGCAHHPHKGASHFNCHSSAAFLFVVASAAMIQSTLLLACRLLSKRELAFVHATASELLYYVVFFLFFLIAGLAVELNLDVEEKGYNSIMAGGVFGITNSILFLISAVWFFTYFNSKTRRLVTNDGDKTNDMDRQATNDMDRQATNDVDRQATTEGNVPNDRGTTNNGVKANDKDRDATKTEPQ